MLKKFVSSAVENSTAAKLSLSEEDQILKKVKGFISLGEKIKQTLLKIASDGITIPLTPSEFLQEIISDKSGPNVAYLMSQWHINEDFMISRGMAHNLGYGNLFSTDPTIIDNASIFFASLKSAKSVKMVDQNELFALEMMNDCNALSKDDTKKMLESSMFIPTDFLQLLQQVRNFKLIMQDMTSADYHIVTSLQEVKDHIRENQSIYLDYLYNTEHFAISFLQELHLRVQ